MGIEELLTTNYLGFIFITAKTDHRFTIDNVSLKGGEIFLLVNGERQKEPIQIAGP